MAQNFIECDREQLLLMSPSLREWLPENHGTYAVTSTATGAIYSSYETRPRSPPTRSLCTQGTSAARRRLVANFTCQALLLAA